MTPLPVDTIDDALELAVLPSYTRIGYTTRQRLYRWTDPATRDLSGRVVLLTGATSGIGLAAARLFASTGATLLLLGRDEARTGRVCEELRQGTGNHAISALIADLHDFEAVETAASEALARHDRLDVLIHNAGTLAEERQSAPDGTESTIATHVIAPFLLTARLLPRLVESEARVITMSSGGMYTSPLHVMALEMDAASYSGPRQYARAKRAQVTLNEMWAERMADSGVRFHAMHPGWVDTPGLSQSLPGFRRALRPLLRSPEQGADTLAWLAADDGRPLRSSGRFWLDRKPRSIHRLRMTRRSDTPERRGRLWLKCCEHIGWTDGLLPRTLESRSPSP